jgi:hypothetical protein
MKERLVKVDLVRSASVAVLLAIVPILASATQDAKPSSEAMKYLEEGSKHYLKHDYKEAIVPFAKALELEKKHPTLDKTLSHVLIDNLGMAYGMSGDLENAKETFEYGLSKDKVYPMFYYLLACTYAEMEDLDGTIVNLKLAFKYKGNVLASEQMPDPSQDDSFQRFLKNDRFITTLREVGTADAGARPDRIVITEASKAYVLTVPVSRLVMTIPRDGFVQGGAPRSESTASSRYFHFQDTARHLFLSGWFEAQSGFPGMTKFWEGEVSAWSSKKLPAPENVVFKKIGGWETVIYRMPQTSGNNSHIRAEWLAAGTWIDLHVSVDSESSATENLGLLETLLAGIVVSEK